METSQPRIGFIYYTFYPVKGGASVHGYNLARELYKLGYKLFKVNGEPDPYTTKISNKIKGIFWILSNCDIIYLRLDYFLGLRNFILFLALLCQKQIIVEVNSPSDELSLHGYSSRYIQFIDWFYGKVLKKVDAVIVVSKPLKEYCTKQLKLENVFVVENGGEFFFRQDISPSPEVRKQIQKIKKNYQSIVIWSGSVNKMQNIKFIYSLADKLSDHIALVIVSKHKMKISKDNTFLFCALDRESVKYIIKESSFGLAFYSNDYSWCRWGFYNSSLKLHEFINNGLLTLTNVAPETISKSHRNLVFINDPIKAANIINCSKPVKDEEFLRTWKEVAEETQQIIQQVLKSRRN